MLLFLFQLHLRPLNLNRARNVEIEIGWVQAPLEDSGIALMEAVGTGLITPAINSLINLPLIQITLDRVETVQRIVKSFVSAKPGVPTGEAEHQPQHPGPLGCFNLPPFTPDKVFGLYQFCISPERVIPKQATLVCPLLSSFIGKHVYLIILFVSTENVEIKTGQSGWNSMREFIPYILELPPNPTAYSGQLDTYCWF